MNIAKLRLFDALDGGDHFWSSQIREHGEIGRAHV